MSAQTILLFVYHPLDEEFSMITLIMCAKMHRTIVVLKLIIIVVLNHVLKCQFVTVVKCCMISSAEKSIQWCVRTKADQPADEGLNLPISLIIHGSTRTPRDLAHRLCHTVFDPHTVTDFFCYFMVLSMVNNYATISFCYVFFFFFIFFISIKKLKYLISVEL